MRYRIHGVNRATNSEMSATIEASSREMAEAKAQKTMIVAEIVPEGGAERDADLAAAIAAEIPDRPSNGMGGIVRKVPTYAGITNGASVLSVFSILSYVLGVICLVAALVFLARCSEKNDIGIYLTDAIGVAVMGGICLAVGAFLGLVAASAEALRDIAINSFDGRKNAN